MWSGHYLSPIFCSSLTLPTLTSLQCLKFAISSWVFRHVLLLKGWSDPFTPPRCLVIPTRSSDFSLDVTSSWKLPMSSWYWVTYSSVYSFVLTAPWTSHITSFIWSYRSMTRTHVLVSAPAFNHIGATEDILTEETGGEAGWRKAGGGSQHLNCHAYCKLPVGPQGRDLS